MPVPPAADVARFGDFTVDLRTGELFKHGRKIRLEFQPSQVLGLLLGRAGQLVSRDEFRDRLWSGNTFVDFDDGLNTAIRKLRQALRDSPARPQYIETLPRRGYRFIGQVKASSTAHNQAIEKDVRSLGLVPFVGVDQKVSGEVWDILEPHLRRLANVRIVRASGPLDLGASDFSLAALASGLHLNLLMMGAVHQSDDRAVFRIRVVDPVSPWQWYARTFVETGSSPTTSARSLAATLVPELARAFHHATHSGAQHDGSPRAQELYLEGRHHWNKRTREGNEHARRCFLAAIEEDCLWGLPPAGLADCYVTSAVAGWTEAATSYGLGRAAANRAIGLDRNLAEPHATLGAVYWLADWNWRAAENEFQTALSLNPGYGEAYMWYGRQLFLRGYHEEAIRSLSLAQKLDPLSKPAKLALGIAWYVAREFKIASAQFDEIADENPHWGNALYFMGLSHLMQGNAETSIEALKRAVSAEESSSRPLVGLAQAYWIAGNKTAARAVFDELIVGNPKRHLSPCDVAEVLSVFGDRQGCLKFLRKAVDERCGDLAGLRMDPMYDAVRNSDEFKQIESLVFGDA